MSQIFQSVISSVIRPPCFPRYFTTVPPAGRLFKRQLQRPTQILLFVKQVTLSELNYTLRLRVGATVPRLFQDEEKTRKIKSRKAEPEQQVWICRTHISPRTNLEGLSFLIFPQRGAVTPHQSVNFCRSLWARVGFSPAPRGSQVSISIQRGPGFHHVSSGECND